MLFSYSAKEEYGSALNLFLSIFNWKLLGTIFALGFSLSMLCYFAATFNNNESLLNSQVKTLLLFSVGPMFVLIGCCLGLLSVFVGISNVITYESKIINQFLKGRGLLSFISREVAVKTSQVQKIVVSGTYSVTVAYLLPGQTAFRQLGFTTKNAEKRKEFVRLICEAEPRLKNEIYGTRPILDEYKIDDFLS